MLTTDTRECWKEYDNPEPYFGTVQEALFQAVPGFPDVEMHVVSCAQQRMPGPAKLAENIWFHGLHVPKIGWLRTGYQGCVRAVRKKLQEIRPDIVHGQGTERDCAISAVLSGFPNLLTIHGNMGAIAKVINARAFSYQWLMAQLERFTIPRSGGVLCITNYTREQVRSVARRTWVLPNPVDIDLFSLQNQPITPAQILHVAHIQQRKNQIRLIEALDPITSQTRLNVTFYGKASPGDPYAQRFLKMVQERSWCRHGFANRKTLKAALQTATLLVLPSLEENCPMSVLEAMAAGVPVVAANTGGTPELFEDGVSGLFCDPLDVDNVRTVIHRVLKDRELARTLASQARKRAWERFHPKVIMEGHLKIYRELLNSRS